VAAITVGAGAEGYAKFQFEGDAPVNWNDHSFQAYAVEIVTGPFPLDSATGVWELFNHTNLCLVALYNECIRVSDDVDSERFVLANDWITAYNRVAAPAWQGQVNAQVRDNLYMRCARYQWPGTRHLNVGTKLRKYLNTTLPISLIQKRCIAWALTQLRSYDALAGMMQQSKDMFQGALSLACSVAGHMAYKPWIVHKDTTHAGVFQVAYIDSTSYKGSWDCLPKAAGADLLRAVTNATDRAILRNWYTTNSARTATLAASALNAVVNNEPQILNLNESNPFFMYMGLQAHVMPQKEIFETIAFPYYFSHTFSKHHAPKFCVNGGEDDTHYGLGARTRRPPESWQSTKTYGASGNFPYPVYTIEDEISFVIECRSRSYMSSLDFRTTGLLLNGAPAVESLLNDLLEATS